MPEPALTPEQLNWCPPTWLLAVLVPIVAIGVFAYDLSGEPPFVDEWAYISQAYFADIFFQRDNPGWLEYPAYDLPPLPKYLIGLSLHVAGYPLPPRSDARAWYRDNSRTFGPPGMLLAARWPSVIFGALGCLAVFSIGTMLTDRRVGVCAAVLLMANPLYRLHARRAMSDVPAEALILATIAVGLFVWRSVLSGRIRAAGALSLGVLAGLFGGLAVLAKLNGALGLMTLGAWVVLAWFVCHRAFRRAILITGATTVAGVVAFGVFVLLNPFMTADPEHPRTAEMASLKQLDLWQRADFLREFRVSVSKRGQKIFPKDALTTIPEKFSAVAVQGFGRFGLFGRKRFDPIKKIWWFDSTRRYDWAQDAGIVLWAPWVLAGMIWKVVRGGRQFRQGDPPLAWALLAQVAVAYVTVSLFIPLAWDRYFISLQASSCLLAASVAVAGVDALLRLRRMGEG